MDYTGLVAKKYRVNRKLTDEERSNQFRQKKRLDVMPFYNLSVVRVNATYLECVDRWFIYRGELTAMILLFYVFTIFVLFGSLYLTSPRHLVPTKSDLGWMLLMTPIATPACALMTWLLLKESFRWTHFPIRFNHRNRMVYVFRTNGTVLQVKWNKIFFTLGRCEHTSGSQNWDIRGHVLDKDGETVRETFALPGDSTQIEDVRRGWEFFRRYMEEGPASVYRDVYWCHDIAEHREKYKAGLQNLFFPYNAFRFIGSRFDGFPFLFIFFLRALTVSLSPALFVASLGRWFAMRTSKIPVWPAEVEAQCAIDAFDPYLRNASHNPERIPMQPIGND